MKTLLQTWLQIEEYRPSLKQRTLSHSQAFPALKVEPGIEASKDECEMEYQFVVYEKSHQCIVASSQLKMHEAYQTPLLTVQQMKQWGENFSCHAECTRVSIHVHVCTLKSHVCVQGLRTCLSCSYCQCYFSFSQRRYLTRRIGFEAVMRMRCTDGKLPKCSYVNCSCSHAL